MRSTKPENMTNPDDTPKFWFHKDHCWYCDAKGHDRQSCDKYKKFLAANSGRRPAGYEGAFEKARKAHRAKHGSGNTSSPSRNTLSSQRPAGPKGGKGGDSGNDKSKRHVKGVTESEGESDDDASNMESSDDEQSTSCQSLRLQTKVFAMRCAECVYEYVCSSCRPSRRRGCKILEHLGSQSQDRPVKSEEGEVPSSAISPWKHGCHHRQ